MTPEQVDQKMESDLVRFSERYMNYKARGLHATTDSERLLCRNTMSLIATEIKDVLFKMYLRDLEAKCQPTLN
jgi:hypothetical protein